jgi:hypothetical protein
MKLKAPLGSSGPIERSSSVKKLRTPETRAVVAALKKAFPRAASVDAYRHGSRSIRVRVIDPTFRRIDPFDRIDLVSDALETLPISTQQQIVRVVPITPAEHRNGVWSHDYEFDHPLPVGD